MDKKINDRLHVLEIQGKEILFQDYTNLQGTPFIEQVNTNKEDLLKYGRENGELSILLLSDVTGSALDQDVMYAFRDLGQAIDAYIKAAAIVGMSGIRKYALKMFNLVVSKERRTFDDLESAKRWLAENN